MEKGHLDNWIKSLRQHTWLQHLAFWGLSFYVLFRMFLTDPEYVKTDLIYDLLFHISLLWVVYVNLKLLIPLLFRPGRYLLYVPAAGALLVSGAGLNELTFTTVADWLFPGYYFISYYEFSDLLQFMVVYLVLSTLLKLSRAWFVVAEKEKRINQLEREKLDAELGALKAQIDPHLLFNNLNNLYSLALDNDRRVPGFLLQLGSNLRYTLYDCRDRFVSLAGEVEYLKNYIALQRLRMDQADQIDLQITGSIGDQRIAPLLLVPFVENGFKHGLRDRNTAGFIRIALHIQENALQFQMVNNKAEREELTQKGGGIGLANVRRRLDLLYPQRYQMKLDDKDSAFSVYLKLEL